MQKELQSIAPSIEVFVDHIEYIIKLAGIDYVAIGSDYDGLDCLPKEMTDCQDHIKILENLEKRGYSKRDIEKVMGQPLETTEPGNEFETSFGIEESDTFYQIGPTSNDWTCLFHFREGKLLTYHPISPETISDTNEDEISVN